MSLSVVIPRATLPDKPSADGTALIESEAQQIGRQLEAAMGGELAVLDAATGQPLVVPQYLTEANWPLWGTLARQAAERGQPEFLVEHGPLVVFAVPLDASTGESQPSLVAVGVFVVASAPPLVAAEAVEQLLGLDRSAALEWLGRQPNFTGESLERLAAAIGESRRADARAARYEAEAKKLAQRIAATYEEITLLYRLTQNLMISRSDEDLCRRALSWFEEVIPAKGFAIRLAPLPDADPQTPGLRTEHVMISFGECPIDNDQFGRLVKHFQLVATSRPVVVNPGVTGAADWPFPGVSELILVPVADGEYAYGWLAAFNHRLGREFGTDEAQLLSSVATILGTHAQNVDLYRQQAELLAGVVRALTSAIDAKDPYTCGHSDRVARVAVRLGQELGLDNEELKIIYLSGLLHDVGKIGIEEVVLRKPGKLTPAEFEHIKTHTEIGYNILADLKKLAAVLPGVRHHHEAWDGSGYPHGLKGEAIPFMARIMAVADAFDAMGSDRPYRRGMDPVKLDKIIREGAGKQWDAQVVAAYFRVREELEEIAQREADGIDPDLPRWTRNVEITGGTPQPGEPYDGSASPATLPGGAS